MRLGFDRHCAEIATQTALLADHLDGADVAVPVPTCVTDLLPAIYRCRPVAGLHMSGDATFVDFWLERVAFG